MSINSTQVWTHFDSPLGQLTLIASERGLEGLLFSEQARELSEHARRPERFGEFARQLDEYFAGSRRRFDVALDLSGGTPFQAAVWKQLESIPYGTTLSYAELAARLGRTDRVRAVGAAVGRTPVPIIVPCHRVIASDGKLTGYRGGLERKRALLDLESGVVGTGERDVMLGSHQLALL